MRRSRFRNDAGAVRHQVGWNSGLTGVPVIALEGGKLLVNSGEVPS